jgi:cytochrome d ubiquinol oxidase subunit II
MHGGLFLALKRDNPIQHRAIYWSRLSALTFILLFATAGIWTAYHLPGYTLLSKSNPLGYSNPLNKVVGIQIGAWVNNYANYPILMLVPALGFLGAFLAFVTARWSNHWYPFLSSALCIIGVIGTVGVSMFPFILPSSRELSSSLLIWDASSSYLTLLIMLGGVIIFMPMILFYTSWVYRALSGKAKEVVK